jgi:hypothetical protein
LAGILGTYFGSAATAGGPRLRKGLLSFLPQDTISRTRSALRDLELDSLVLSMPFGAKEPKDVKFFLYTDER